STQLSTFPYTTLFRSSEPDAALHVYLSEEEPDGTVRYVTEGVLRALHRKLSPCPPNYRASWPYRTHDRADAAPLVPGQAEDIARSEEHTSELQSPYDL